MDTITITETGCYLDNHRGHYITRDMIDFATDHGFIIDPFAEFALRVYEDYDGGEEFPHESLVELADEAINWLNSGQSKCHECAIGSGDIRPGQVQIPNSDKHGHHLYHSWVICKACSGSGRGDRIKFQNFPPIIPMGTAWGWNDGDFGLYWVETDGECAICGADGTHLSDEERTKIEDTTGEPWWVHNCTH